MQKELVKIHPKDNVAVALKDLKAGHTVDFEGEQILISTDTSAKHKVAIQELKAGDKVYMYGVLVGKVNETLKSGDLLTTENTTHQSAKVSGRTETTSWEAPDVSLFEGKTFDGYHRPDGQVGTRNVWLFFPLVFCENRNIEILKDAFEKELLVQPSDPYRDLIRSLVNNGGNGDEITVSQKSKRVFENVDVQFITHQGGCGGIRQDSETLALLLSGYINNPNVAGATVLSLGCQNLQIEIFKNALKKINPDFKKPLLIYEQQQLGTIENMLQTIIKDSLAGIKQANEISRKPAPLSKLTIGLECGGSDGFSGISANPVLGGTSDLLVSLGGKAVLSEFPELCGVEQELVNRCVDDELAGKFMRLMKDYEKSAEDAGSGFDMNPSPGNIKDGLITDAMKSAGAAKKGGTSPVADVLDYGEYVNKPGLTLLCTPGNDVESTTAMAGAGANIILFTTGLGTPTGNPITPVIKVSSNSKLVEKMPDIIDVDTGSIISGESTIDELGEELLNFIIEVASGRIETKAMLHNQADFIPWKRGVSL